MIVNNHHLTVFPGEDYQTFERDLPGQNVGGGFSADAVISKDLPLESNDIIGKSWGYVTGDTIDRSTTELVHLLIKSAGLGANFLLNIGPTPEGEVRRRHKQRLLEMGDWLKTYGETIYGTRKSFMAPADWGVAVEKGEKVYLHITNPSAVKNKVELKNFPYKTEKAFWFETGKTIEYKTNKENSEVALSVPFLKVGAIDQVIVLQIKK